MYMYMHTSYTVHRFSERVVMQSTCLLNYYIHAHVHTGILELVCTEKMLANMRNGRKLEKGDINTSVPR